MEILLIIYASLGYWATGQTIYYNKIIIHAEGALFLRKLIWGFLFGWILIPAAIVLSIYRNRE